MLGEATIIDISDFERVDMRVGRVVEAEPFPEARKPAYKLRIDFGPLGMRRSSAQLTMHYRPEQLVGKLVVAVTNFPARQIGPVRSEVLVLGVPDAPAVLRAFVDAIRPFIAERYATGADLGTREEDIIAACQLVGLTHPLQAGFKAEGDAGLSRVKEALALSSEGVPITELIAGYGVAESTFEAADVLGLPLQGATVALQGFGNVGGAAA